MSSNWEGVITIHEILGRGLSSKDNCNPFIKVYFGENKFKAKKIMKTVNPHWEDLSWKIQCNATDTLTFEGNLDFNEMTHEISLGLG